MESIKDYTLGLMGIHLLDAERGVYSKPSQIRKGIGLILNLTFFIHFISIILMALFICAILVTQGLWLAVIPVLFGTALGAGAFSIPGWVFIDWEKKRLKNIEETR